MDLPPKIKSFRDFIERGFAAKLGESLKYIMQYSG